MEELSLDNILTNNEVENLFVNEDTPSEANSEDTPTGENEGKEKNKDETTEINENSLFSDESESVGSERDNKEKEDTDSSESSTSPKFYSSIAKAFAEEGIFPDLDEDVISKIETPEDFRDIVEKQIQAGIDERYKRIDEALRADVDPNYIKQYEGALNYLDSIKDDVLSSESNEGEELRKRLIYQDYINRGYSQERAQREVQKSLNGGTDIDDAKEALKSNKDYFKQEYNALIKEGEKQRQEEVKKVKEQAEKLKSSLLDNAKAFGDLEIDKNVRQKAYDNITKPIYKDPDTGQVLTALQRYEKENKLDFLKNISLVYTLTNGFKDLDGLVKGKVKKEMKRGIRELETTLNNTSRTSDGSLNFASGIGPDSFIGKGWTIDV